MTPEQILFAMFASSWIYLFVHKSNRDAMLKAMKLTGHETALETRTQGYLDNKHPMKLEFRGVCSCGAHTDWVTIAGLISPWFLDHQEEQAAAEKAARREAKHAHK